MTIDTDPIKRLAMQRIIAASADIEAQFAITSGTRPVLILLLRARDEAATALARLASASIDTELCELRTLQNEVRRYDDLVEWIRKIVSDGFEYEQQITAEDREEMTDLLIRSPEGQVEAINLGLVEPNYDDDTV